MIVLGIDVSKAKLDCCLVTQNKSDKKKTKRFDNVQKGFDALIEWLKKDKVELDQLTVVMEATSIYHENIAYFLHDKKCHIYLANPARVRAFAKSMHMLNKTDKADSFALARYAFAATLIEWQPEPQNVRLLKALMDRRAVVYENFQQEKNRLEKTKSLHTAQVVIESIHTHMAQLDKEVKRLDQEISTHVDDDPDLKNDLELLTSIPAVGKKTGLLMLGLFHSRDFKKASQAAAFVGLVPVHFQSGSSVNKRSRLSKAGPSKIRAGLFMAAIVATQYNPHIMMMYKRLCEKGKAKKLAIGAAMRKLVHICYGVLKHQKPYQPDYLAV